MGPVQLPATFESCEIRTVKEARVLVVDDEPIVRDVLCDILENEGYVVAAAGSATAALETAEPGDFDVLIADLRMPDMSGLELIKKFRERDPHIVPLLITGTPSAECVAAVAEDAIADCLVKPVGKARLCAVVANALLRKRRLEL